MIVMRIPIDASPDEPAAFLLVPVSHPDENQAGLVSVLVLIDFPDLPLNPPIHAHTTEWFKDGRHAMQVAMDWVEEETGSKIVQALPASQIN